MKNVATKNLFLFSAAGFGLHLLINIHFKRKKWLWSVCMSGTECSSLVSYVMGHLQYVEPSCLWRNRVIFLISLIYEASMQLHLTRNHTLLHWSRASSFIDIIFFFFLMIWLHFSCIHAANSWQACSCWVLITSMNRAGMLTGAVMFYHTVCFLSSPHTPRPPHGEFWLTFPEAWCGLLLEKRSVPSLHFDSPKRCKVLFNTNLYIYIYIYVFSV